MKINQDEFNKFQSFIEKKIGIKFPQTKKSLLESRITNHIIKSGFTSFEEYYQYLLSKKNTEEYEYFIDKITTHTTYFFREIQHFDFIIDRGIDLINKHFNKPFIKILSVGASTGEEMYSLALIFEEQKKFNKISGYGIDGFDISKKSLLKAKNGIFHKSNLENIPKRFKVFFKTNQDTIEAKEILKKKLKFFVLNVSNDNQKFPDKYHLILCRNILIYFTPLIQQKIINNLLTILLNGGFFITGTSESLHSLNHNLKKIQPNIYKRQD